MLKDLLNSKSWKTTSAGALAIIGGIVQIIFSIKNKTITEQSVTVASATILTGIGLMFARDNNKTSDDVGAGTKTDTENKQ